MEICSVVKSQLVGVLLMFGLSFLSGFLSVGLLSPDQELRGLHACMRQHLSPWSASVPPAPVLLGSLMPLRLALPAAT